MLIAFDVNTLFFFTFNTDVRLSIVISNNILLKVVKNIVFRRFVVTYLIYIINILFNYIISVLLYKIIYKLVKKKQFCCNQTVLNN